MTKPGLVTITEFAKLIGVSRSSVLYAVKRGRIKSKKFGGKNWLNPKTGQKQWHASLDKVQSAKSKKKSIERENAEKADDDEGYSAPPKFDVEGDMTAAEADRREKVNRQKLSELKYLEQAGKLVQVEKIQRRAFELGRKTRDAIMAIPARVAHEWAVETDPHKLEVMVTKTLQAAFSKVIKEGKTK